MDGISLQFPAAGDRYSASVILHREAHFGDNEGRNATTAEALMTTGQIVGVTFHLAYPPAVSYFCVLGPGLGRREDFEFKGVPEVVSCEKDLVLVSMTRTSGPRFRNRSPDIPIIFSDHVLAEYFIYKAARGKPSLRMIVPPPPRTGYSQSLCILPRDDLDGEFFLADLVSTCSSVKYQLYVFSSETGERIYRGQLELEKSSDVDYNDLWRGIKVCNVLDEEPVLNFIPLPNAEFDQGRSGDSRRIRDVVLCDGDFIKFVEIDRRYRQVLGINDTRKTCKKMTNDLDNTDIIHDSEMLIRNYHRVEPIPVPDGWKIRTCSRHTSWDYWRKGHTVDVDDLYDSMPEQSDGSARKWAMKDLATAYPALSIVPDDDVVCLMSKVKYDDTKAWMIGLHLGKKTLEIIKPYSASYFLRPNFLACAFSEYLN